MEEKEKPRLSRLTAIITQLQSKKVITASYLAQKHKVSVRTIYRDIRTLDKSGIPIITVEGKGYSLIEGYQLPPVQFTEDEANALITAEQLILKSKDQSFSESYSNAIIKIKSVLKYSQKRKADLLTDRIYFKENDPHQNTSNHLMKIQFAITNFQLLKIKYRSLNGTETQREIEPFAIYSTKGKWLLIAFCRLRNNFRAFRIDLIQHLSTFSTTFTPHDMTLEQYFELYVKKD
ncbi:helix-turn-helix transcriptional regulator [Aureispira anguillae]|uniref:YafY family transcriptional regulator n=1 Tax=Aureispira anguillae TaxID=2864201 RepID=A0A916DRS0_9BACT|nr:YafY family protein [Aureispira anguillae]BDS11436.1 YafY family transcriptional regulator [Aureispira anguillae]